MAQLEYLRRLVINEGLHQVTRICLFKVQIRERNFVECINSLTHIKTFDADDIIMQISRCSFDNHIQETLGTLMVGATSVMLRPNGIIDFEYLSSVFAEKQITYVHTVPSLLFNFFTYIRQNRTEETVKYLRSLKSIGRCLFTNLLES